MFFKHNASGRHHVPKVRRRVTNWPTYKDGLQRCGDLTFWLDKTALTGWRALRRTTQGGQPLYAEMAIELVLTLRLIFHLALRQLEDFARSEFPLLGLDLSVPYHSTLSRRRKNLRDVARVPPGMTDNDAGDIAQIAGLLATAEDRSPA